MKTTHAPYNFIPFAERPLLRYDSPALLPPHGIWNKELLSGEIRVKITAQSPIYIGSGKEKTDFYQNAEGNYVIPGSTFRGLIRENMQILGFGLLRPEEDFQDYYLLYRRIADANGTLAKDLRDSYLNLLKEEVIKDDKKYTNYHVKAGILAYDGKNKQYYIVPIPKPAGEKYNYYSVSRDQQFVREWLDQLEAKETEKLKKKIKQKQSDRREVWVPWAFSSFVWYHVNSKNQVDDLSFDKKANYQSGYIMAPGPMIAEDGKSQKHLYLFPRPLNMNMYKDRIVLSDADVNAYKEDYKLRSNQLNGIKIEGIEEKCISSSFWEMPKWDIQERKSEEKPVFYIEINKGCENGKPEKRYAFGMSKYLRLPYDYSIIHGLPETYRGGMKRKYVIKKRGREKAYRLFLDYPYAIMGYTVGQDVSYSSRVSFDDMVTVGKPEPLPPKYIAPGEPKLSFFPGYSVDGKHYNVADFQFRGYKQYWLKEKTESDEEKKKYSTELQPLPKGTDFIGSVRYHNLYPDELGLLLWCLVLEEDCNQNIGRGKPYGYGRVKIEIDQLWEYQPEELYGPKKLAVDRKINEAPQERVQALIAEYKSKLKRQFQINVDQYPLVKDFMYMKRTVQESSPEFSYMDMDLSEFQNIEKALPTVEDYRAAVDATPENVDMNEDFGD